MTRPADAQEAARIGAAYVGVIFAGGPRAVSADAARDILHDLPPTVGRVGVFGRMEPASIAAMVTTAGLDIVQLHADPDAATVREVRRMTAKAVWGVVRVNGVDVPAATADLFDEADAVVLDARAEGSLGGTGRTLPWEELAGRIDALRGRATLVLAGGLTPLNVSRAAAALAADVVDVSSGVELATGIKDHQLMRAFIGAVRSNPEVA
jgi:phosphoribosylanthranilate isomerase